MKTTPFNSAKYGPLMSITDQAEADAAFDKLVEEQWRDEALDPASPTNRNAVEAAERNNLAVYAALNEPRAFAQVERLFKLDHQYYRTQQPPEGGDPGTPPSGGSAPVPQPAIHE
jgi:hypothetical protein